jgi:SagB-type dehydrogenase family enzyme
MDRWHSFDPMSQPLLFKIYQDLEPIPLPKSFPPSRVPALAAISAPSTGAEGARIPDLPTLASILYHSAGITRRGVFPGGEILFRAAACTGALYHIELYLVCGPLPGLEAGVYHFGAHDFALRRLRQGDYRAWLTEACGYAPSVAQAPAVVACTGTFWRNAWKYRARTYRHCFWDDGTILANLLAISAALGVPARIVAGFVDRRVNGLLGLDEQREVALSLVPLGATPGVPAPEAPAAPDLDLRTVLLSAAEIDYPAIRAIHRASCLATFEDARAWHGGTPTARAATPTGRLVPLGPYGDGGEDGDTIERTISRRGSSRQFLREQISLNELSAILDRSTQGIPADFLEPAGAMLNDAYLIAHAVAGLSPGAYVYRRDLGALELLKEGEFRREAGYLGLQQALPADASVDVFFLADLHPILDRYGNRGYRAAQLEAGILGGKMYLAAYAQRLGATGLTFFDDDVTRFFSPHAQGKSAIFLVAVGKPLRRSVRRRTPA